MTPLIGFLIFWAITFIAGALLRAATKPPTPAKGDVEIPTAEEGTQIPAIFGTVKIAPNTLWFGDLRVEPIKGPRRVLGLAGPRDTIGYRYHVGMQGGLCWGPVDSLVDIVVAGKYSLSTFGSTTAREYNPDTGLYEDTTTEVIAPPLPQTRVDAGVLFTVNDPDMFGGKEREGGLLGLLRFYWGSATQGANSYLGTKAPAISGVAYHGLCYAVWEQMYMGTTPYIKGWQFVLRRCPTTLGTLVADTSLSRIGNDANPAEVLYELVTDTRWGLGRPTTDYDTDSFTAALQTLSDEGLGISGTHLGAEKAEDKAKEILATIDGVLAPDPLTGLIALTLIRADYVIDDLETLTPSNSNTLTYSRPDVGELTTEVKVRYTDIGQGFTTRVRPAYNPALRAIAQRDTTLAVDYPLISTGANADRLALRDLKAVSSTLATGSLTATRAGSHLAPGAAFLIDYPDEGLTSVVARATRVNYGSPHSSEDVEIQWTEDVFGTTTGAFTTDPPDVFEPPPTSGAGLRFEIETEFVLSDTEGCLTLRITGDVSTITLVETRTQKGGEAAGDWTEQDNSAPITVCVDRDDIETGHIAYRVTYTAPDGTDDTIEDEFDVPPLGADDGNATGTPGNFRVTFIGSPPEVVRNVDSALRVPKAAVRAALYVNTTKVGAMREQLANHRASGAGVEVPIVYSVDGGSSWDEAGPTLSVAATGFPRVGSQAALVAGAVGENVLITWAVKGGDGTTIIEIGNFYIEATSATNPPDSPVPSDLPQGGPLGNIIHDEDAIRQVAVDGAAIPVVTDFSVSLDDATPDGDEGQTAPTMVRDAYGPGLDTIRFVGVDNNGVSFSNPTGGSFTRYFLCAFNAAVLPSGAVLFGATTGGNNAFNAVVEDDGRILAQVNDQFIFPSVDITDDAFGGMVLHLHCWTFDKVAGHWQWFTDAMADVDVQAESDCQSAFTADAVTVWQGTRFGLPLDIDWCREVTYDAVHAVTQRAAVKAAFVAAGWPIP